MASKIAVVTGASSGIGRALALELSKRGFEPLLIARRKDKLEEVAGAVKKAGGSPHVLALDVCAENAPEKMLQHAEKLGEPHALVNNAGFGVYGRFADIPRERSRAMIDLNVRALVDTTHVFLEGFVKRKKGHVLNVASTAAFQCGPYNQVYAATKAFVLSFTEAISEELRGTGVTATALCPGPTETEFFEIGAYEKMAVDPPKSMFMSAEAVARVGVKAMLKGKPVAIAGVTNAFGALAAKVAPRFFVARTTGWMFRPRS